MRKVKAGAFLVMVCGFIVAISSMAKLTSNNKHYTTPISWLLRDRYQTEIPFYVRIGFANFTSQPFLVLPWLITLDVVVARALPDTTRRKNVVEWLSYEWRWCNCIYLLTREGEITMALILLSSRKRLSTVPYPTRRRQRRKLAIGEIPVQDHSIHELL